MILVIRISGIPNVSDEMENSLTRIRLRRKYSAVLLKETKENLALLKKIRNLVAYGNIDDSTLKELIEKRAHPIKSGTKIDVEKVISSVGKKSLQDMGIKPFFRLHSPRGGIESKKHFGVNKGVLGDNGKKINELVRRML